MRCSNLLYLSLVGAIGLAVLVSLVTEEADAAKRHDDHHRRHHNHRHREHKHEHERRTMSTGLVSRRSPGLKEECSRRDQRCCHRHAWQAKVDPEEWEYKTGCRLECCRDESPSSRKSRKGVVRTQIVQDLISCITDIIGNVINLRFNIPKVCCKLPLMSLLPTCRGGGGTGADSGPKPPVPVPMPTPGSPPSPPSSPGPQGAPGPSDGRPKGPGGPGGPPNPPSPPPSDDKRRPGGLYPGLGRTSDNDEDY